jgi:hypothetical protein
MWLVLLKSTKDRFLGINILGQQVPPRVRYGMTCLQIRDVIGSESCSNAWVKTHIVTPADRVPLCIGFNKEQGMHPRAASCPTTPDPASLLRWAPALSRALQLRTPPPYRGGLRCCYVPYGSEPYLPAEVGPGAAT